MPYNDENCKELTTGEMNKLFNPQSRIKFNYKHGLLFIGLAYLKSFEDLTSVGNFPKM